MDLQKYLKVVIRDETRAIREQFRESKLLLIAFMLCLVGIIAYLQPFPDRHIHIGTFQPGSAWYQIGESSAGYLNKHGLESQVVVTDGAVDNVKRLIDPKAPVNAAFTYGIALDEHEREAIVSLGSITYEPIWVFYRKDKVKLTDLHDLAKYRVGLGPRQSGSYAISKRVMSTYGIDIESNPNFIPNALFDAEQQLADGKLDALIVVTTVQDSLVQQLMRSPKISLYSFDNAAAFDKQFNSFEAVRLPAGSVNIYPQIPANDISLVATTTSVVVKKDMHPDLQLALLMTIREINRNSQHLFFAKRDQFPAYVDPMIPLSPVAAKFYDYGPPQVMRYLPFWIAGFIDRAWILLLTLFAIFYPLSKLNPHIRKLRFMLHERPFYEELLEIDEMLSSRKLTEAEKEEVWQRLSSINEKAVRHGIPVGEESHHFELVNAIYLLRRKLEIN